MAQAVEEWYRQMPIITRSYLTAAVVTTVGCTLEIISPYHLYLNPKLVVQHYEIWRLVTNFLYFRKMGLCLEQAQSFHPYELSGPVHLYGCILTMVVPDLNPEVLLGFSILVGSSTWVDLLGMIAGHVYYFLEDVYPRMTGRRPLKTPSFIKALFADDNVVVAQPPNAGIGAGARFGAMGLDPQAQ
ncbi:derlin2 [Zea mays]|uniref:Derlin n=1 Tax=Zea mays TaxID=4577 RepID=A0A1D6GD55_MAIZE|nr:derlin2 [Zea mays]